MLRRRLDPLITRTIRCQVTARGMASLPKYIDIGVNLTDPVFSGSYHGKQAHQDDLDTVLARARAAGVAAQIITGGSLTESQHALELASKHDDMYSTAGCHPTRTSEMDAHEGGAPAYLAEISHLIRRSKSTSAKIVAIGECGLDYDRLHFAPADVQRKHFATQLDLSVAERLPLFLHSRAAHVDFVAILRPRIDEIHRALQSASSAHVDPSAKRVGVVHSFTGTMAEMEQLVSLGLFIGINGCSLKTQENLNVAAAVPLDRIMFETDAPWCDPRSTHASHQHIQALKASRPDLLALYQPQSVKKEKWTPNTMVKGRNEPCVIGAVAAAVAHAKGIPIEELAAAAERNTRWLFGI